jgi:hypothetical protein
MESLFSREKESRNALQALAEQDMDSARTLWIRSRISQSFIHSGKASCLSHSRQGLFTRYPISKSNRYWNGLEIVLYFMAKLYTTRGEKVKRQLETGNLKLET